ncbi:MAG: hypothetical protein AAFR51_18175 [Pseudomonadota bacterium]
MIRFLALTILYNSIVFNAVALAQQVTMGQTTVGTCEKDGYEIRLTTIENSISGSNAAEALPGAHAATAYVQMTSISPGPMREDETCTRIKWRGQGGCVKASAQAYLPKLASEELNTCADYNETVQAIREQMVRLLRDRVSNFRQTLGQCETQSNNPLRVLAAKAAAITGDPEKNRSVQNQIDALLEAAAFRVDRCIPVITVKEYGSRAYYQFDEKKRQSCGLTPDPQMLGVNVYAPAKPLMKEVRVSLTGGDGVLILSRNQFTASIPGEVGSIPGYAKCEPRDVSHYTTTHPFVLIASEPVYWIDFRGSEPSREYVATLERKCAMTRCN